MSAVADIEAKPGVASVFVVAPRGKVNASREVAQRLSELGPFDVVLDIDITTDGTLQDVGAELWTAVAKSDAMVFVLDDSDLTSEGYVELGAAWARDIPTLAVAVVAQPRVPVMLAKQQYFHEASLADADRAWPGQHIRQGTEQIHGKDRRGAAGIDTIAPAAKVGQLAASGGDSVGKLAALDSATQAPLSRDRIRQATRDTWRISLKLRVA
jgi:nucleoside 2-deoxyribosyltransferase